MLSVIVGAAGGRAPVSGANGGAEGITLALAVGASAPEPLLELAPVSVTESVPLWVTESFALASLTCQDAWRTSSSLKSIVAIAKERWEGLEVGVETEPRMPTAAGLHAPRNDAQKGSHIGAPQPPFWASTVAKVIASGRATAPLGVHGCSPFFVKILRGSHRAVGGSPTVAPQLFIKF